MLNKQYYTRISDSVSAIIDEGCDFKGKLSFEGVVRLGGDFEGQIFSNDVLIIEETAMVRANIESDVVVISGKVIGDVTARTRIEIFKPAMVKGNLTAPVISIEEGVIFDGMTRMG
jgi:cytoskeletal protein CcmA (bactofilin family)